MKKRTSSLPILVVVAVVALVIGSFGTATAAGLTKSQVKKIATKVVNKKASSLSVAHAASADTATNASNLGGQAPATYLNRVAFASSTAFLALSDTTPTQILGPTSITVPAGTNFVHVTAAVTGGTGGGDFIVWVQKDAACALSGPDFNIRQYGNAAQQMSLPVEFVDSVTPGAHTYRLCGLRGATATNVLNPALTIETVQVGATGGTTIARPADGPAGSHPASTR